MEVEEDKTVETDEDDAWGCEADRPSFGVEGLLSKSIVSVPNVACLRHRLP